MVILLLLIVILGVACWALCKLVSVFVGVIFVLSGMTFLVKMAKQILK